MALFVKQLKYAIIITKEIRHRNYKGI